MQHHQMKLVTEAYNSIVSGKKVIESRLFDEKRQRIMVSDQIVFSEIGKPENKVSTVVAELLRYQTFKKLFANHDPTLFGGKDKDSLLTQIKLFYSEADEQKYGVLGIRIKLQNI